MNKTRLFYISIFAVAFGIIIFFLHKNYRFQKKYTYAKHLSKNIFNIKLNNFSESKYQQIKKDFSEIKIISQEALKTTFDTILSNAKQHQSEIARYRILDNKLYRYYSDNIYYAKEKTYLNLFEKALLTLTKITQLPALDLIISSQDGTPLISLKKDFYFTESLDMQAPILSWAKIQSAPYVVLIPDGIQLTTPDFIKKKFPQVNQTSWDDKKNILFWRGTFTKEIRKKLCSISLENPTLINAGFGSKSVMNDALLSFKTSFKDFLDFYKGFSSIEEQCSYKYLPVIDGCMCTYPGYQWRLLSNSVVFKQKSKEIQWFYLLLEPNIHYVPVKNDLSDITSQILWAQQNDEICNNIAKKATEFVLDNLTFEDIYVYFYKVLHYYSSLQDFDKKLLKKDIKNDKNWILINNRKKALKIAKQRKFTIFNDVFSK